MMELKDDPTKESCFNSTPIYETKLFGGMIVTVVCLGLSLSAYLQLKNISSDIYDITDNWKSKPVTDVFVPSSNDADCPSGYSYITVEKSDFTGISKGPCGCVPNLDGYISGAGNCSTPAENTQYCMSAPTRGSVKSTTWRGSKICFKRDGEPASSWTDGYFRRPYPNAQGECSEGYKRCGLGQTYDQGAVCFPADSICPITGMLVAPIASPPSPEYGWNQTTTFPGGEYALFTRREHVGELPIVDLELHLTEDSSGDYLDGEMYDANQNRRGPCYTGSEQVFSNKAVSISDDILWLFEVSYPSRCSKKDKRFELFDQRDLLRHFLENIAVGQETCDGHTLLPLDDPLYSAATDPDYRNSGVPCDDPLAGYTCSRPSDQLTNCANGDSICDVVINQNVCGQYAQAARALSTSENSFGMYRRSEIMWRESCAVSPDDIYTNMDPLTAALAAQMAGVVVSFVFGVLFGLVYPGYGLWATDKPGKWRVNARVERNLMYIDPFLHLCKLGPLIAAIFYIGQIHRLYAAAGKDACSDDTTNSTFSYLGETLPSIYNTSLANVLLESGLALMAIYSIYSLRNPSPATVVPEKGDLVGGGGYYGTPALSGASTPAKPQESSGCCASCCCCCCKPAQHRTHAHPVVEMGPPPIYPPSAQQPMQPPPPWGAPPTAAPQQTPTAWGAPPPTSAAPPAYYGNAPGPQTAPPGSWGTAPAVAPSHAALPGGMPYQPHATAVPAAVPMPVPAPVVATPVGELVSVVIPFGSPPGSIVQCTTPTGQVARFLVPAGVPPGSTIQIRVNS